MRFVTVVIAGCIALAVLKVAVQVAVVVALALLLWFGITRPRETFGFLIMFVALGVDRLLGVVMPRVSYVLQFAADLLGHCAASGADPYDTDGELAAALAYGAMGIL